MRRRNSPDPVRRVVSDLTLEDIAKESGVSRSTVSRVINDHPNVSDKVRRRVQQVITQTGYHPNAAARTLASRRSNMIGLVLPQSVSSFFIDPYFPQLTQGIAQACNRNDNTLSLFLMGSREDEEKIFPRISRRGLLDGVLVQTGQVGDHLIDRLVKSNIPLVILGRPSHTEGVNYVNVDNVAAAYNAVSHLIRLNYKRIATIAGPRNTTTGIDRLQGYRRALEEHGYKYEEALVAEGEFTESSGYRVMRLLLALKPDAVFAASDAMAIGAMRAALEAGLNIPDDIAFVGFDNIPAAASQQPPLTTVRQNINLFGRKAVETLIEVIGNDIDTTQHVIMSTDLVIRGSCGASRRL